MTPVMTPERYRQVQAVFADAVERPAAERGAFLDAACTGDAGLRAEVESLLGAEADVPAVLGVSLADLAAVLADDEAESAPHPSPAHDGRTLGPYRLLHELGRGGMGTVYLAERADVDRRVALKLIRDPLAAPEHVERFRLERRVLARLDHPHVARLLDAGVTPEGTPWFAMELVDGEPIDRYCDRQRLGIAERLALFEQTCEAVQYAHEHLVVHRDLKPSNILVSASGGVKLLDFGIAKLLGDAGAAGDGLTGTGVRLLTPDYAAPEQLRGEPVTTAADVYALGVVLYALLAGQQPHVRRRTAMGDVAPTTTGPARPSSVISRTGSAAVSATVSAARSTTAARLERQLRGDLDTVVLKALAAEPARRYPSAQQLLDDVRRHRAGRPVAARPDTWHYRARKFVARNRGAVGALAALLLILTGVASVTTYQRAQIVRERDRARREAAKARQVTRFVASLFQDADPYRPGDRTGAPAGPASTNNTAALLGLGADRLERELADQPAVRAELLRTLAVVERNLGRYDAAEALLRRGLAAHERPLGIPARSDAELAGLLHELGVVRRAKSDFAGADTLLARALVIREALPGEDGADLAATQFELGALRGLQGRADEAEHLLGLALASERRSPGPAPADALEELAKVRLWAGDADSGVALQQQVVALRERWQGREHPALARAYYRLAIVLRNAHRVLDAERAVRQALALQHGRLPADHPEVLAAESELSWELMEQGAYGAAERVQRHVLRARTRLFGSVHRDVAGSAYTLGLILHRRGSLGASTAMLQQSVRTFARVDGPDHREVNMARQALAATEAARGHDAAALAVVARLLQARHVPAWDATAQPLDALAAIVRDDGDCPRAAALARRALGAYTAQHPDAASGDPHLVQLRAGAAAMCVPGRAARATHRERTRDLTAHRFGSAVND